jgi:hypothetical protein
LSRERERDRERESNKELTDSAQVCLLVKDKCDKTSNDSHAAKIWRRNVKCKCCLITVSRSVCIRQLLIVPYHCRIYWNFFFIVFQVIRIFKNLLKYDLKSNQIICRKYDLKSQSNRHFPKWFKIKIKSNRFIKGQIILVFLVGLSTCIIILKILKTFSEKLKKIPC